MDVELYVYDLSKVINPNQYITTSSLANKEQGLARQVRQIRTITEDRDQDLT